MELLDFSVSNLLAGFVFGVIGLAILRKGKKDGDFELIFIGLGLMIYPYFTNNVWLDWGVGLALCALAYYK